MFRSFLSIASFRHLAVSAFAIALLAVPQVASLAQAPNGKQYTSTVNDLNKRSQFEIDPTSLGLNISVSLADLPGRGASLPVTVRYGSKIWRIKYNSTLINPGDGSVSAYTLQGQWFQNSVAGWTSSLSVPYVEFTGANEPFIARFTPTQRDSAFPDDGRSWDYDLIPQTVGNSEPLRYFANRAILHLPDGSSHEMRQDDLVYSGNTGPGNRIYVAVDGSRIKYDPIAQVVFLPDGSRYLLNTATGAQYIDRNGNTLNYTSGSGQWTDTLGRAIANPLGGSGGGNHTWMAPVTFGQSPANYIFRWRALSQTFTDTSQTPRFAGPYTARNPYVFPFIELVSGQSLFGEGSLGGSSPSGWVLAPRFSGNPPETFNPNVLSEIQLPNGLIYRFTYNVYAEIDKVYLPEGGYRRYVYDYIPSSDYDYGSLAYSQANRGVVEAWESATGTAQGETLHWRYEPLANQGGIQTYSVMATDPDGSYVRRYLEYRDQLNNKFNASPREAVAGKIRDEQSFTAGGQMLRRVLSHWVYTGPPPLQPPNPPANQPFNMDYTGRDGRMTRRVEILLDTGGDALAKATEMDYDGDLNVIATRYYDYVSVNAATAQAVETVASNIPNGRLLQSEQAVYLVNDDSVNETTRNEYRARNLIALPSKSVIKNAAGIVVAATEYKYDEYALTTYSSVSGWTAPPNARRGNVTRVRRWKNFDYPANTVQSWINPPDGEPIQNSPSWTTVDWIETATWHDQCGSVVKIRDANAKETTTSYADNFTTAPPQSTFAYPTSVTTPVPDTTGHGSNEAFTATAKYDFNTGLVIEAVDANGVKIKNEYDDKFNRLTKTIRGDGLPSGSPKNQTKITYDDDDRQVLTASDVNTFDDTTGSVSIVFYDGFGRTTRAARKEADPVWGNRVSPSQVNSGRWSVADTVYDDLGRVEKVYNPYFRNDINHPANMPTPAGTELATTAYDALGRVVRVTMPDGSSVNTTYSGATVTVKDQANKERSSFTDALGRLAQVIEAPNDMAYKYRTDYSYDALGNLTRVRQGGFNTPESGTVQNRNFRGVQYRHFYYDSLSRLVFASNPEQDATIVFAPPGQGTSRWTMKYEYDPNGNLAKRTDPRGVTSTYSYDALNRNYKVIYSDGTPMVERFYDIDADLNFTYGKGRLRSVISSNIHPGNGSQANSRVIIDGYDAMGRVKSQRQGFQHNGSWIEYTTSRTYNLAGGILTQTYPSGRTVTNVYYDDGRLYWVEGWLGSAGYRYYAYNLNYNAAGQISREAYDVGTAQSTADELYRNVAYNNRFQMIENRLGKNANDPNTWTRGKLVFDYGTTTNNGNVMRQEHYVPLTVNDSTGAVTSFAIPMRDDYEYDSINRLTKVTGRQVNSSSQESQIYTQSFSYDQFGNRRIDAAQTSGSMINTAVYDVNRANNRVYGMQYDPAGNVANELATGGANRFYDAENRMIRAWGNNSNWNHYVYDGDGRRVRRILGVPETWHVYGIDGELVAEYPAAGVASTPEKEYGYRNGQLLVVAGCDVMRWMVTDHLGTPRMEVETTGSLATVKRHDYLPFGEELLVGMGGNGTTILPLRSGAMGYPGTTVDCVRQHFSAKERDNETGLDYFGARYFSSTHGRFTSPDEFTGGPTELFAEVAAHNPTFYADIYEPQSLNKYTYCLNNPLIFVDPDGHQTTSSDALRLSLYFNKVDKAVNNAERAASDVATGVGKSVGNAFIGMSNEGNKLIRALGFEAEDTEYYQPSNSLQAAVMGTADKQLLLAGGLGKGGPASVMMSEGKESAVVASGASKLSPKVQNIMNEIDKQGIKVTVNPKNPDTLQEGNVTLHSGNTQVNIRVETHPLTPKGLPVRHANVEVTKKVKNKNKVIENTHITQ